MEAVAKDGKALEETNANLAKKTVTVFVDVTAKNH